MTKEYTLEDGRMSRGLHKLCDSRDAHEEHMWWEELRQHWYCRGYMANVLLGIQGIMARIDQLDREEFVQKNVDLADGYVYSVVSRVTGEMCNVSDSSAAFWLYRNAPAAFRVIREYPGLIPSRTEWFHIEDNSKGVWKAEQ